MMTAEQLKNSILQLAMQGKLVEQRLEEGSGEDLYNTIQAEKKRLIKEGTIKKQKPLPDISDGEVPFDIPDTWKWVHLGDITELIMGQSPKGENVFEGGQGIEFHQGKIYFSDDYLLESAQTTDAPTKIVEPNTVLLCVRAPVGTVNITPRKICIGRGLCGVTVLGGMNPYFMLNWLRAIRDRFIKKATGTTFIAITGKVVEEELIPLPPLAEQKRIVAKIEELMPFVEQYAAASTKLNTLNATFPEMMKKSILQEAVQGKLVPQDPNDEPASLLLKRIAEEKKRLIKEGKIKKQKPLPDITEEEIPFEIPDCWEWVRLQDLAEVIVDCPHSTPKYLDEKTGYYALGTKGIGSEGKIRGLFNVDKETYLKRVERLEPKERDIVYSREGSIICRAAVLPSNMNICLGQRVMLIRCPKYIAVEYLQQYLMSDNTIAILTRDYKGVGVKHINVADVCKLVVPVPPISEQRRIVKKLSDVMPLIKLMQGN